MTHTVTPWAIDRETKGTLLRLYGAGKEIGSINGVMLDADQVSPMTFREALDEAEANAALVIKAVNSHGKLIEALIGMIAFLEENYDHNEAAMKRVDEAREALGLTKENHNVRPPL